MWLGGSEVFDLYIGRREGGLSLGKEGLGWATHEDLDAAMAHWCTTASIRAARSWRRARLRVWLSGSLAWPMLLKPPVGLKKWAELEMLAEAAAIQHRGSKEVYMKAAPQVTPATSRSDARTLTDPLAVQIGTWYGHGAVLCVACESELPRTLMRTADKERLSVLSIRPWWALALDRTIEEHADVSMFTARDTDSMTLLCSDRLNNWMTADLYAPAPEPTLVEPMLMRKMVSLDMMSGTGLHAFMDPAFLEQEGYPWVRLPAGRDTL